MHTRGGTGEKLCSPLDDLGRDDTLLRVQEAAYTSAEEVRDNVIALTKMARPTDRRTHSASQAQAQ